MGWGGGGVVAHEILVSAQGPLVLGFWVLGQRVWGLGLTIWVWVISPFMITGCLKKTPVPV